MHSVRSGDVLLALDEDGEPRDDRPSVLLLPALGVPLDYYRPVLRAWALRGRHVLGLELRGMPRSPATVRSFGYADLVCDLAAVLSDGRLCHRRVVLVGHSLGGHLALLASASGRVSPVAVVTVGTGTSSPAGQPTALARARRRISVEVVSGVTAVARRWPGRRLGFGGDQPQTLMRDWVYEARHGRYRLHADPTDYEAALASLSVPALMLDLVGDALVGPLAVDHLARRLPDHVHRATVTGHGPLHHVSWVRANPGPVVDAVEHWLADR